MSQPVDFAKLLVPQRDHHLGVVVLPGGKERRQQRAHLGGDVQGPREGSVPLVAAELAEGFPNGVPVEGLAQHPIEPNPEAFTTGGERRVPGDRHDRRSAGPQSLFVGADLPHEHKPGDHRHLQVRQDRVEIVLPQSPECFGAATRFRQVVAPAREHLNQQDPR